MQADYLSQYEGFERKHWWYVARRRIIESFLDRYVVNPQMGRPLRWLDMGCGTGVLLESYRRITDKMGLEMDADSVARGQARGLDIRQTGASWDLGSVGRFDLITLCDVLEHVQWERPAIASVHDALAPGGKLLITVPALRSLWSAHDVVNNHFRRYRLHELTGLFNQRQWRIEQATYYCTFLLPAIWLIRKLKKWINRHGGHTAAHDLKFGSAWRDALLMRIFLAERPFLPHFQFPAGNSILLVATRKD